MSAAQDGAQRVIRLATGESTQRSQRDADHLTTELREHGLRQLSGSERDELWLILDGSDLLKRYAQEMPDLMQVRDLNGQLVPGYRTLNVLGMTPQRRGTLYHRLFSSQEAGFVSESFEVQQALQTVSQAVEPIKAQKAVTWVMDSGLDDIAVWCTIWEQHEYLVCRLKHKERLVEYQNGQGECTAGDIQRAQGRGRLLATVQTEMVVRRGIQKKAKRQQVTAEIRACPLRLTYETNVRWEGTAKQSRKSCGWSRYACWVPIWTPGY